MNTIQKRYTLKAVNDEETTCCVCGKVELKRVMWIAELNEDGEEMGEPFHCGTTCGAKLMQQKISVVSRVVKSFDAKVSLMRSELKRQKENELGMRDLIKTLNEETKTYSERKAHPAYAKMREITHQAYEWAQAQEVTIEIK